MSSLPKVGEVRQKTVKLRATLLIITIVFAWEETALLLRAMLGIVTIVFIRGCLLQLCGLQ